mmetsp:Transcript_29013/g.94452  ORF Transcript_29013/g.94452 Transcript_29013/m.94452 type:complete len:360 (-) Transcript_29013:69-1148(-)
MTQMGGQGGSAALYRPADGVRLVKSCVGWKLFLGVRSKMPPARFVTPLLLRSSGGRAASSSRLRARVSRTSSHSSSSRTSAVSSFAAPSKRDRAHRHSAIVASSPSSSSRTSASSSFASSPSSYSTSTVARPPRGLPNPATTPAKNLCSPSQYTLTREPTSSGLSRVVAGVALPCSSGRCRLRPSKLDVWQERGVPAARAPPPASRCAKAIPSSVGANLVPCTREGPEAESGAEERDGAEASHSGALVLFSRPSAVTMVFRLHTLLPDAASSRPCTNSTISSRDRLPASSALRTSVRTIGGLSPASRWTDASGSSNTAAAEVLAAEVLAAATVAPAAFRRRAEPPLSGIHSSSRVWKPR